MRDELGLTRDLGFLRVAAVVPSLRVAHVDFNVRQTVEALRKATAEGVQVAVFPEMGLTGYTIGDLVHQDVLLAAARRGLQQVLQETAEARTVAVVGLPLEVGQKVYNCAAVLCGGEAVGVVPKTHLPNYKEFYEERWFASGMGLRGQSIDLFGKAVPFGPDLLFRIENAPGAVVGVEICEDLWLPLGPHEQQAMAGATVLLNLSASNELIGKADWRRTMVSSESGRCLSAYCYTSSGIGESSNDLVFSGHALIAENGAILQESRRLARGLQVVLADIDLERLVHDRRVTSSFHTPALEPGPFRTIGVEVQDPAPRKLARAIDPRPFVPSDPARRAERCRDIFSMQVGALAEKLIGSGKKVMVLGVSGGLDSTLSLLVGVKTLDFLGLPRDGLHCYTLPGFGTTSRTRSNATQLCAALGVTFEEIDVRPSAEAHLRDVSHGGVEDLVFENVQARYRTELLFNKANQIDGIVLGTGDLTEIALGWCTFAGDHLSHYHVNASVPKTLVQYLVRWVADEELAGSPAQKVLYDILDTPISPELRRPDGEEIAQRSEDLVGPMELADFYLYPFIRFGTRPGKVLFLAEEARKQGLFQGSYTPEDLRKWLESFLRRFFANQFKRTCLPEGPKIGSVSLSPRGDWRMPSDASASLWLQDLEEMRRRLAVSEPSRAGR